MQQFTWTELTEALAQRRHLDSRQVRWAMEAILAARFTENEAADFLLALRAKGETAAEIADAARVLRGHMLAWNPGPVEVLDTCGTGGDEGGTFNISTAVAIVLAAAGVRVVKHGNRAVSSKSGSADVLTALGIPLDMTPEQAHRSLKRHGLAFCFAPSFHPALQHIAPVRRRLGVPTIFNCLGPLANPAGAQRQLLGVGRPALLDVMAGALAQLGVGRAFLIHSEDGMDEVSLAGATQVREVRSGEILSHEWRPADFGLEPVARQELLAADAAASAALIREVLRGEPSPAARVVIANAAAGLLVAEMVDDLRSGVELARQTAASGAAQRLAESLAADSNHGGGGNGVT